MVRRGKIVLLHDVLTLIKTRKQVLVSDVISEAKLSSTIAYEILEILTQSGLIETERNKQNRQIYKINQNGKKTLRAIRRLESTLTPIGMAYLGEPKIL